MAKTTIEIPYKFPSLNEYTAACRSNKFAGAQMKKRVQNAIGYFINRLPNYTKPIKVHFHWVEGHGRRDLDNICFAKKFILDALVECGKLKDDNRKIVTSFTDTFEVGKEFKVILEVEEIE